MAKIKVVSVAVNEYGDLQALVDNKGRVWFRHLNTGVWTLLDLPDEPKTKK